MVNEKYKNSLSLIGTESKKIKKNSIIKNLRTMIDSNKPSKIIKRSELVTKVDDIHYTGRPLDIKVDNRAVVPVIGNGISHIT